MRLASGCRLIFDAQPYLHSLPGIAERNREVARRFGRLFWTCRSTSLVATAITKPLALGQFDSRDGPLAVLPLDRNPQAVKFVKPNLCYCPGLSITKDHRLANKF